MTDMNNYEVIVVNNNGVLQNILVPISSKSKQSDASAPTPINIIPDSDYSVVETVPQQESSHIAPSSTEPSIPHTSAEDHVEVSTSFTSSTSTLGTGAKRKQRRI